VIIWTIKLKIVSNVKLDPQGALIAIGTLIVKRHCYPIYYDVRWASRPVGLLFILRNLTRRFYL